MVYNFLGFNVNIELDGGIEGSLLLIKGGIEIYGTFLDTNATLMALVNKGSFHLLAGVNIHPVKFGFRAWCKIRFRSKKFLFDYNYSVKPITRSSNYLWGF